jgi:U3 small nucleolar ribonucleoprotein protein IMP3
MLYSYSRYNIGLIPSKESLEMSSKVNASRFCRRRLPLILVRNHMSQGVQAAVKFVEQGHVRVGPERVTDPAFLVTRKMEDYVTWTDTSAIKKQIEEYNGLVSISFLYFFFQI